MTTSSSSSRTQPLLHPSQIVSASMVYSQMPARKPASINEGTEVTEEPVLFVAGNQLQEIASPETSTNHLPEETLLVHQTICLLEEISEADSSDSTAIDVVGPAVTLTEFKIFKRLPPEMRLNIVSNPFPSSPLYKKFFVLLFITSSNHTQILMFLLVDNGNARIKSH